MIVSEIFQYKYLDVEYYNDQANLAGGAVATRILKQPSESALHVWVVLWKAARAMEQNALRSVSGLGLGLSDFAVLEVLLHKGPLPVNVIGKKVFLASGSITAAIDRLECRKLVKRTPDPVDRRSQIVQLTAAGRTLIEQALRQHGIDMEDTMAVLGARERSELIRLLKKTGLWAAARLESEDQQKK